MSIMDAEEWKQTTKKNDEITMMAKLLTISNFCFKIRGQHVKVSTEPGHGHLSKRAQSKHGELLQWEELPHQQ